MPVAIDSSVMWAILKDEPGVGAWLDLLIDQVQSVGVIACEIVVAETASFFSSLEEQASWFEQLGIAFRPISPQAAFHAGHTFRRYRDAGGSRTRMIADFLVAAHALVQADGLMAMDRGYHRTIFHELKIIEP